MIWRPWKRMCKISCLTSQWTLRIINLLFFETSAQTGGQISFSDFTILTFHSSHYFFIPLCGVNYAAVLFSPVYLPLVRSLGWPFWLCRVESLPFLSSGWPRRHAVTSEPHKWFPASSARLSYLTPSRIVCKCFVRFGSITLPLSKRRRSVEYSVSCNILSCVRQ